MQGINFDFNNMFSFNVGPRHGVTYLELSRMSAAIDKAHRHLSSIIKNDHNRVSLGLEWVNLSFQDRKTVNKIQLLGREISRKFKNIIFLGIGGSFLGLKAAQDALLAPYYNEFSAQREGHPKIYFEGNNLDPDTLAALMRNLDPAKTFVVVISKSGETTETKAAFKIVEEWLKKGAGKNYGRQIIAITDPQSGSLRRYAQEKQKKDVLSFRSLPLLKGVGGRFSELNIGLLHLAIVGVNIREVLDGAKAMYKRCSRPGIFKNPAYMYAALQNILYRKKGKTIAIIMPFSETLKSTADWYVQLLAESLGKKYGRRIRVSSDGRETWEQDPGRIVNTGRTPVSARGTNDLHSIQQNNIEGRNDKTVTFIKVQNFQADIKIPGDDDVLGGRKLSELMHLAQEATAWALVISSRPNCTVIMPQVTPFCWGQLLFFFEMATAFEGELLNVNAFDQPGVESYKNYMYYKLGKPGLNAGIAHSIKSHPLRKKKKLII
ncbi:MAG: glucose-6-phosphate isomerase [Candidatus Omnitrophica bacterium]|nr:glucose-6-phosphate isomerase [Candidatus Omnitrophota bacterium]